jgi:hypothetical protein
MPSGAGRTWIKSCSPEGVVQLPRQLHKSLSTCALAAMQNVLAGGVELGKQHQDVIVPFITKN